MTYSPYLFPKFSPSIIFSCTMSSLSYKDTLIEPMSTGVAETEFESICPILWMTSSDSNQFTQTVTTVFMCSQREVLDERFVT